MESRHVFANLGVNPSIPKYRSTICQIVGDNWDAGGSHPAAGNAPTSFQRRRHIVSAALDGQGSSAPTHADLSEASNGACSALPCSFVDSLTSLRHAVPKAGEVKSIRRPRQIPYSVLRLHSIHLH